MILVDVNIALYAIDRSNPGHEVSRTWFEETLSGDEEIRFALSSLLGFLRISTNPGIFECALSTGDAILEVQRWMALPNVGIASPTDRHWDTLAQIAQAGQARGPLLMDAHLAALAIEHGATLATTDRDFSRFAGLRTIDPLATRPAG